MSEVQNKVQSVLRSQSMSLSTNKVVRLPDGRFITRKLVTSDPFALAMAQPDEIWETSDGRRIVAKDMELKHLMNAIFFMEKEATEKLKRLNVGEPETKEQRAAFKKAFDQTVRPQYAKLREELEIRLGKRERVKREEDGPRRCLTPE
jgi:hypothetical protein